MTHLQSQEQAMAQAVYQDYPCSSVIGYSRVIVTRADLKVGEQAKSKILSICDTDRAIHEALRHRFQKHIQQPDTGILASPRFIGEMRAQTLRRLAHKAKVEHTQVLARLTGNAAEYDAADKQERAQRMAERIRARNLQLDSADNPNGFLNLGRFLVHVAALNDTYARDNRLIGIEQAIFGAMVTIAAERPRLKKALRKPSSLRGH